MSGPKSSRYRLSAAEKRRQEAERLERIRQLKKEKAERIDKSNRSLNDFFKNIKSKQVNDTSKKNKGDDTINYTKYIDILDKIQLDNRLGAELKERIQIAKNYFNTFNSMEYKKSNIAITIIPIIKEYEKCNRLYEETVELRMEYSILCEIAGVEEKSFGFSSNIANEIEDEIIILKSLIADKEEDMYIKKSIDEVMHDMGYDVIGYRNVIKNSGKKFSNKIYKYYDGTAVNVTIANDGQIVMELCGIDYIDRLPQPEEETELCKYMEKFCVDFPEVERRLAQKGVIVDERLQKLPPTSEYAQIINVSEYEILEDVEKFEHRSDTLSSMNYLKKE